LPSPKLLTNVWINRCHFYCSVYEHNIYIPLLYKTIEIMSCMHIALTILETFCNASIFNMIFFQWEYKKRWNDSFSRVGTYHTIFLYLTHKEKNFLFFLRVKIQKRKTNVLKTACHKISQNVVISDIRDTLNDFLFW
jgi:hypothetical protein